MTTAEAELTIEKRDALLRLFAHKDFKAVISEGYFKDEAVRLVEAKGNPMMADEADQAAILKDIDGIGSLRCYFHATKHAGDMAEKALEDEEADRLADLAADDE